MSSRPGKHVLELDGIRALAIWGVLVAHLLFALPAQGGTPPIVSGVFGVLGYGWLGVDLFFVLSGYLITGILLAAKGSNDVFRRFYERRARRIWPLYFLVLGVLWIAYGAQFAPYLTLCTVFLANLAPSPWGVPDAAGPLWSLAVEEQFYFVWPWVVLLLNRRRLMAVCVAVVVVECLIRLFARPDQLDLTWFRADGLAMGAFLAASSPIWSEDPRKARYLAYTLLAAAGAVILARVVLERSFGFGSSTTISAAVCAFGAAIVIAVAHRGHPLLAVLRWRLAGLTAVLSYAIYLVHMPIANVWQATVARTAWFSGLGGSTQTILRAGAVVIVCYAVALVTRRYIEAPLLRVRSGVAREPA